MKNMYKICLVLCAAIIFVSCSAGAVYFGSSTVEVQVQSPLSSALSDSSRAVLGFEGQTIKLGITLEDGTVKNQELIHNGGNIYTAKIELPIGTTPSFTVEAKDVTGKTYVKGTTAKKLLKPQESVVITLAPLFDEENGSTYEALVSLGEMSSNELATLKTGEVLVVKVVETPVNPSYYSLVCTDTDVAVCRKDGSLLSYGPTPFTIRNENEIYVIIVKTGVNQPNFYFHDVTENYLRPIYVSNGGSLAADGSSEAEPTTLAHAVQIANSNTTLVSQIFLLEDITVSADSLPLIVNNAAYITSLNPQNTTCSITPDGPCTSLFIVNGVSAILNVYNVTIQANTEVNGNNSASEGLIQVQSGFLFMDSSFIQYNNAGETARGGGIYAGTNTGIYLFNTTVQNCSAHLGGGLFLEGVINELEGVTINACSALADTSNRKGGLGGGIYIAGGVVNLSNSTAITACTAQDASGNGGFGGAVYVGAEGGIGSLLLDGVTIGDPDYPNTAQKGGGVYVGNNGFLDIMGASSPFVANGNTAYYDEDNPGLRFGNSFYVEDYSLDHIQINGTTPAEYGTEENTFTAIGISYMDINEYLFRGKGTGTEPYEISTTDDIRGMAKVPVDVLTGTWFEQKNDITFEQYSAAFPGIPFFSGTYIGNGHEITNIPLDYTYCEDENFGLFSTLNSATVEGLLLRNILMSYYDNTHRYVGVLVGKAVNSTLEMCGVIGEITDYNDTNGTPYENGACGGLIGYAENTSITKSFAAVKLLVKNTRDTGGLAGYMNGGSITDCYTAEYVTGETHVGSMIGYTGANGVPITASYAASEPGVDYGVTADVGFIGAAEIPTAITQVNTYSYNEAKSGYGINALTVLDDNNIKKQGSYTGFNFSDDWDIIEDYCAPFLQWQALFYKPLYENPNI